MTMRRSPALLAVSALAATVLAANWLVSNVGHSHPSGLHTIPVGFGLHAPSGVVMIGVAFTLRDWIHDRLGVRYTLVAVLLGGIASAAVSPQIAAASAVTFVVAELADLSVYGPLRRRSLVVAALASNLVGSIVDSFLFLWLAVGAAAMDLVVGQTLGKLQWSLVALPFLLIRRSAAERRYGSMAVAPGSDSPS